MTIYQKRIAHVQNVLTEQLLKHLGRENDLPIISELREIIKKDLADWSNIVELPDNKAWMGKRLFTLKPHRSTYGFVIEDGIVDFFNRTIKHDENNMTHPNGEQNFPDLRYKGLDIDIKASDISIHPEFAAGPVTPAFDIKLYKGRQDIFKSYIIFFPYEIIDDHHLKITDVYVIPAALCSYIDKKNKFVTDKNDKVRFKVSINPDITLEQFFEKFNAAVDKI